MRPIDILVVVVYLAAVVAVGIACRGRSESVDEYFTAHGLFSGWLGTIIVGLSIAATFFSGISLIIYISSAYSDGVQIAAGLVGLPIAWAVLHFWFLPRFLAGRWSHPYEIVGRRFSPVVRRTLSAMFALMRIGWMGVLVYAPAMVLMGTANLSAAWFWPIVLLIGISSTVYTTIGGIRGVIITDAIQFVVIAAGMVFIGGFLWVKLDLPAAQMWHELGGAGHLQLFNFSFDVTNTFTFWAIVCGITVSNLGSYVADQMALQRYLASSSPRDAARSFLINVWGALGVVLTLVFIGLLLWLWYRHHPDAAKPEQPDRLVSYFIAKELPAGVSGLLIAAVLAATMSSMTSGINALAGALTNDWVAPLGRPRTSAELYQLSRRASFVIGIVATLCAGVIRHMGSLLDATQIVMSLFLGPMLACMILSVARSRATSGSVLGGMALGLAAGAGVVLSPATSLWVAPVSCAVTLLSAIAAGRRQSAAVPAAASEAATVPSES